MEESLETMIARIDENVIHLKEGRIEDRKVIDDHIYEDKEILKTYLKPLWEAHQQTKGAAKLAVVLYTVFGGAVGAFIGIFFKGH